MDHFDKSDLLASKPEKATMKKVDDFNLKPSYKFQSLINSEEHKLTALRLKLDFGCLRSFKFELEAQAMR